jgi:hypothetical protein
MTRRTATALASFALAASILNCTPKATPVAPDNVVAQATPARASSVTITAPAQELFNRGATMQLTANVILSNGFVENQTSASTWSSDNTAVASVSSTGVVTAGDEGTATIRATYQGLSNSVPVRVRNAFRTPDPPPGQRLAKPNPLPIIREFFFANPALVARSCQDSGGTWEYMDGLVDRLRLADLRYAYNGRRGDANFVARDEIAYHWGAGPSLNSREVYVWDTMGGHCGPNPVPVDFDLTDLGGIWLGRGRFTSLEDAVLFVKPGGN